MKVAEIIIKLQNLEELNLLTPAQVSDYQLFLASHIEQVGNNIILAEQEYNKVWKVLRETAQSDKTADKLASISPEWIKYRQAIYAEKTLLEVIRSLKKKLKSMEYEYQNQY